MTMSSNLSMNITRLKVNGLKSSANEMTLEILSYDNCIGTMRSISHSSGMYDWIKEGQRKVIPIPPGTYLLNFRIVKPSRKDSMIKTKGETSLPVSMLIEKTSHSVNRYRLTNPNKNIEATMDIEITLDLSADVLGSTMRQVLVGSDVLPFPRLAGQLRNSLCNKNIQSHSDPNKLKACWLVANALWEHLSTSIPAKLKEYRELESKKPGLRASKVMALMYPPDNNVLYDVCEQMNDQMAFLDQCFTRTKGELLRNASWNAVLAHSCRETVEETLKGALMLYGSSQYYVGGGYASLDDIAQKSPEVCLALDDAKWLQLSIATIRSRLHTSIPPVCPCPADDEATFSSSLLQMALEEFKHGHPPLYHRIAVSLRGRILEDMYAQLLSALNAVSTAQKERDLHRRYLTQLVQQTGRFPSDLKFSMVTFLSNSSIDAGGQAEIFKGQLISRSKKMVVVAMKRIQVYPRTAETELRIRQMYLEVLSCATLRHPNVIRVFGVHRNASDSYILTPLMPYGNVRYHIPKVKADQISHTPNELLAFVHTLIEDIIRGLEYLHGEGIVHGDLRGVNILVDKMQKAVLTDFGLAVYMNAHSQEYWSIRAGNLRWTPPECLSRDGSRNPSTRPTAQLDIWSFALVCIELYTDQNPYHTLTSNGEIIERILGKTPAPYYKPPDFVIKGSCSHHMPEPLWNILSQCWVPAAKRPASGDILRQLKALTPKGRLKEAEMAGV